jgi:hypothetical protein
MKETYEQPEPRADVIVEMRAMAQQGAGIPELVHLMQARTGAKLDASLPAIWYFCKAFHLPLKVVLPLREWFLDHNDDEINAVLLPEIANAMAKLDLEK